MTTNIYPANVRIGFKGNVQQEYRKARVRTNRDETRIQVWVSPKQFPHRALCVLDQPVSQVIEPYRQFAPMRDRKAQWRLVSGVYVAAESLGGCGCGSPLKVLPQWTAESQEQPQTVGVA